MKVAVGADHLGLPLKDSVKAHLTSLGHEVVDFGARDSGPVDYPDVAVVVAREVAAKHFERAILVCGTGIGMAITANKVPGVRAANVADPYSAERAAGLEQRPDLVPRCPGRGPPHIADILVDHWLATEFAGGDSARKVGKIDADAGRTAAAKGANS